MAKNFINIREQSDILAARQTGRQLAQKLGFGLADQTRLATAISELTRNVIQYAGEGTCLINDESDRDTCKIRVVVEDSGPGIPDIEQALRDGFTTGSGLGVGLPGARRLVHNFDLESRPGHTRVTIEMLLRKR